MFCGGLVAGAYMTKVPPALPQLRAELGLSLVESTFIVTTFNVLGMLVGVLAGMLGDRFGRKRLALAGLVLMAAGIAADAVAGEERISAEEGVAGPFKIRVLRRPADLELMVLTDDPVQAAELVINAYDLQTSTAVQRRDRERRAAGPGVGS